VSTPAPAVVQAGLAGRVIETGGLAVPRAVVSVIGTDGRVLARTTVDADGSFALADLPNGSYALAVLAPQFRPSAVEVALPNPSGLDVVLVGRDDAAADDTAAAPEFSPVR
jgi:hypothetical protein